LCLETRPWDAPFLKLELFGTQKLLSIPGTVKLLESPGRAGGLLIIIIGILLNIVICSDI
ncbi:MAG: hypothetical protein NTW27_05655, partial [Deltaproteobacteria bacterium]|nr:hypothetical protein [Deltaproteobacteria bacterium]